MTGADSEKAALDQAHHGRVAVITGGGRGFGQAFGTALAARGAHVVLADIDADAAEAAASKLAVRGVTVQLAREFAADGIRVNAIAPGLIFTDTIRAELGRDEAARVMGQQILPREGQERDIVDALLFLVSPAASFVTGETLRVSGGFALSV